MQCGPIVRLCPYNTVTMFISPRQMSCGRHVVLHHRCFHLLNVRNRCPRATNMHNWSAKFHRKAITFSTSTNATFDFWVLFSKLSVSRITKKVWADFHEIQFIASTGFIVTVLIAVFPSVSTHLYNTVLS